MASAARRPGEHPLGWVEGGGGSRRGTAHRGVAGPGGRSAKARAPGDRRLELAKAAAAGYPQASPRRVAAPLQPCSFARGEGIRCHRLTGPAGRRRGAVDGETRCRRPPLAPPGPRHARRPFAAAGAGDLGGRARGLGPQLRHRPRPGDLRAGSLGTPATPGCCSLRCPRTSQPGLRGSALESCARGLRRPRPVMTPPESELAAAPAPDACGGAWENLTSIRAASPAPDPQWPPLFERSKALRAEMERPLKL